MLEMFQIANAWSNQEVIKELISVSFGESFFYWEKLPNAPWNDKNYLSFTQVNVFGFGASSTGTWHHYFDKTRTHFKGGPHGGDFENKTMHQLKERNKISIYKGYG